MGETFLPTSENRARPRRALDDVLGVCAVGDGVDNPGRRIARHATLYQLLLRFGQDGATVGGLHLVDEPGGLIGCHGLGVPGGVAVFQVVLQLEAGLCLGSGVNAENTINGQRSGELGLVVVVEAFAGELPITVVGGVAARLGDDLVVVQPVGRVGFLACHVAGLALHARQVLGPALCLGLVDEGLVFGAAPGLVVLPGRRGRVTAHPVEVVDRLGGVSGTFSHLFFGGLEH